MKTDSIKFTEAHFDAKASRYQAALRSVPRARTSEILPFLFFLSQHLNRDSKNLSMADLLCGSGVLTAGLKGCFKRVYGIDVSRGMLHYYPMTTEVRRIKAAIHEQSTILTNELKPDVIAVLAGLHHIYEIVDGKPNVLLSDNLQQSLMLDWAACLPPDGVMIVADVTAPNLAVTYSNEPMSLAANSPSLARRFSELCREINSSLPSPLWANESYFYENYMSTIRKYAPDVTQTNPGEYFHHVVAKQGLYGHVDHFLNPSKLLSALRARGYMVKYYELPTPWIFPSADAFIFFFYEKFALGPQVDAFDDIPLETKLSIREGVERYLGVVELPEGGVTVGWRLGYYVVSPPARNIGGD